MQPVYRLREVVKTRTAQNATFRLVVSDLEIAPGEQVAMVGQSGCGKSTLLDMLAMVLQPTEMGGFMFKPRDITEQDIELLWRKGKRNRLSDLRKRHIGYVLQTGGLLPYLTVRDNIALSRRLQGLSEGESTRRLAEGMGIEGHLDKLPGLLSAGERQRVAIARALAHEPSVVIADEPTASLDPITGRRIMKLFMGLVENLGMTVLVASHDWDQVDRLGLRKLRHHTRQQGDNVTESVFTD